MTGLEITHERGPNETERGKLIKSNAGTMSNNTMCCSMCALKR